MAHPLHPRHGINCITYAKRNIQKGWREPLLCQQCETLFSRWETWVSNFWNLALPANMAGQTTDNIFMLNGVEYEPFKLFHLSILWRASVANRAEFGNVSLGPYDEKLRTMLLKDDPGPENCYPI